MTGYAYGADGYRLAKGTITSFKCDFTKNGFSPANFYAVDPGGEQVDETDGSYNFLHSNVFLNGSVLASYDADSNWHYAFNDWLGTRRVQASSSGAVEGTFLSLPFGDNLTLTGSSGATEHQFVGKERDQESNLDDFPARDYGSNLGRFMSPDPSGLAFADPGNPQSLNLYSYSLNSPLTFTDPSGEQDCSQDENADLENANEDGCDLPPQLDPTYIVNVTIYLPPDLDFELFEIQNSFQTVATNGGGGAPSNLVPKNPCNYMGRALPPSGYAMAGKQANGSLVNFSLDVAMGFPRGGYLDAQPLGTGSSLQRAAYGNYAFGVYMASAGISLSTALSGGNAYAFFSGAKYGPSNGPMDPNYQSIPAANVANITNGYNAQMSGTTCHN